MVIEHTFITTMEADEAVRAVADFLTARGFAVKPAAGFAPVVAGAPAIAGSRSLDLSRGVANPVRAKGIADLPQKVRLDWDRGRVNVAASILPKNEKIARRTPRLAGPEVAGLSYLPTSDVMGCLLLTIVRSAELLLAHRNPEQAAATWALLEDGLANRDAFRKVRGRRARNRALLVVGRYSP